MSFKVKFFDACEYVSEPTKIFRCKTDWGKFEMTMTAIFSVN